MYDNNKRLYHALQLFLDCLCLGAAWESAIRIRILLNPALQEHVSAAQVLFWTPSFSLILSLWIVSSFNLRLYRAPDRLHTWSVLVWAFENTFLVTTVTAVVTFFSREFGDLVSRMFVPLLFSTAFVFLVLGRYVGMAMWRLASKRYIRPSRIALVGDWKRATDVIRSMPETEAAAIRGVILPDDGALPGSENAPRILGTVSRIAEVVNRERLDRVFLMAASFSQGQLDRCTQTLEQMRVTVRYAIDPASEPIRLDVRMVYGLPFVEMVPIEFTRAQELAKRIFDVIASAGALLVLAPVFAAIAVIIKLTSQGPILYKSRRVGKGGRHFTFLKFRSMYVAADLARWGAANEKTGHIFKMRDDPRVTPVGRFLRSYSLDELPQLLNVLRGEMSLVGPRPLPASDLGPDGMSEQFSIWSEARSRVWPGLTGLWQVSGRSDLTFEDMVALDLRYIQNWSLALDVKIIVDTPMLVLRGVGAY